MTGGVQSTRHPAILGAMGYNPHREVQGPPDRLRDHGRPPRWRRSGWWCGRSGRDPEPTSSCPVRTQPGDGVSVTPSIGDHVEPHVEMRELVLSEPAVGQPPDHVAACPDRPPPPLRRYRALRRALTSQNTSRSLRRATRSSSPRSSRSGGRQLRSRIPNPSERRWAAARASPQRPTSTIRQILHGAFLPSCDQQRGACARG